MHRPKTFDYHPSAREFWRWAKENEPRHRKLMMGFLPVRGQVKKIKNGGTYIFWKRLLDHLVSKGWPAYCMIWTDEEELIIFERYLLQGVRNEIQRNRIR